MRFLCAATITITIATLAIGTTHVNAQIDSEIEVLKSLARSTGNWDRLSGLNGKPWLESTASSACSLGGAWAGVTCERILDADRVVEISYPSFDSPAERVNGTISNIELRNLPYLRKLDISNTEITGPLPNLSTHPTLKSIKVLWNPKFTTPITTSNIPPQLESISITDHIIQGNLPSFDHVNATTLKSIQFDNVQVTGTLPSFQRFINLEECSMRMNNITGSVPPFGPSLRHLVLHSNQLSVFDVANIPPTLGWLELAQNKIVAPFPNLSKMTDPQYIDLSNNGFYGPLPLNFIPAPFKGLSRTNSETTYYVNIQLNYLTGPVPAFTAAWLQSRAAPNVTHKLMWRLMCNLFQTGTLPSLQAADSFCYDNQETFGSFTRNCANCQTDFDRVKPPPTPTPTNSATPTPPNSGNGNGNTTPTPPPTKTNTTNSPTSPPTKPAGPNNHATTTTAATTATATSMFTGIIATVAAAAVARF